MTFDPNDPDTARWCALILLISATLYIWGAMELWT
jgi:hypothetical protein